MNKIVKRSAGVSNGIQPGSAYAQLVNEAVGLVKDVTSNVFDFYWKMGEKAIELSENPDKYGKRVLETFVEDIERTGNRSLGVQSMYHAKSVRTYLTPEQLEIAKNGRIPLRDIIRMCNKRTTPETREKVLLKAKNHTGTAPFDTKAVFQAEVAKSTGGSSASDKKSDGDVSDERRARKILKGAEHIIYMLEQKLKTVGECVDLVCSGDDAPAMKEAKEAWENASAAFDSLKDTWQRQANKAIKSFDKIKAVLKSR